MRQYTLTNTPIRSIVVEKEKPYQANRFIDKICLIISNYLKNELNTHPKTIIKSLRKKNTTTTTKTMKINLHLCI